MKKLSPDFPLEKMSQVFGVSRSGYYRFLKQSKGKRAMENELIMKKIKAIFHEHKGRYGSPRIYRELKKQGVICSENLIAKLMKANKLKLKAKQTRKWRGRKIPDQEKKPNLLERDFSAKTPNTKWVSDITQVKTAKGWAYLCAVLDLFSRKIVGHAIKPHMKQELVGEALEQAVKRRKTKRKELIFHSDQGVQYGAKELRKFMAKTGIIGSMSGKGSCYDNAVMESFFSSYKRECVQNQVYESLEIAQKEAFNYIESYYNNRRQHSALGYLSPVEFEKKHEKSLP